LWASSPNQWNLFCLTPFGFGDIHITLCLSSGSIEVYVSSHKSTAQ
jgi:hypothetical protein